MDFYNMGSKSIPPDGMQMKDISPIIRLYATELFMIDAALKLRLSIHQGDVPKVSFLNHNPITIW